ncbi:MAG TPA: DUF3574 domain-containing protein [Hyphomicrobiaceae bacterium]|nr:DUF3574 domain-containing protein [Hyphomicrobiaceae bacterium]
MQYLRWPALVVACMALGAGALAAYRFMVGDPGQACRAGAASFARLELLFGLGRQGGGVVSEEEWRAFLAGEVTPRFPDGLTVVAGYGQWRGRSGEIAREPSRVLAIWYRPDAGSEARIEAIRQAYKAQFGQESVMRVDGLSCVSF